MVERQGRRVKLPGARPLRGIDAGIPDRVRTHKSGGRDRWSPPRADAPADPAAAGWGCLDVVLDPEIPLSLVELGLVYGLEVDGKTVRVRLTYTATACPCQAFIREDVRDRLLRERWIEAVEIEEVWDPPWTNERITDEGRRRLKRLGLGAA